MLLLCTSNTTVEDQLLRNNIFYQTDRKFRHPSTPLVFTFNALYFPTSSRPLRLQQVAALFFSFSLLSLLYIYILFFLSFPAPRLRISKQVHTSVCAIPVVETSFSTFFFSLFSRPQAAGVCEVQFTNLSLFIQGYGTLPSRKYS